MDELTLLSMFMLGILGTGHCIGMCGPLVIVFPAHAGGIGSHLFYHLGRIFTYMLIGALMGGIGTGLAKIAAATGGHYPSWVAGIQMGASWVAAVFLFFFGLVRLGFISEPGWMVLAAPHKIPGYRSVINSAFFKKRHIEMLLLGMLLGLLPCGLSFAAFTRALAAGGSFSGASLVLAFGLGTLPGLLLLGTGLAGLIRRYRSHFDILAGLLMIYLAAELAVKAISAIV